MAHLSLNTLIVHIKGKDCQVRRFSVRKCVRSEKRTVNLPIKRRTKRYSFEFYEDQLIQLKKLKYQAEMTGEQITQSDMVREALDLYLKERDK
jgi:hypothetical protein